MSSQLFMPGTELKYEFYFPENACMVNEGPMRCPTYSYPLENVPTCKQPCNTSFNPDPIYGTEPMASELYGDALAMNEGDGSYYYHGPGVKSLAIGPLTYPKGLQDYHFTRPF
jgi:hypothetical protein